MRFLICCGASWLPNIAKIPHIVVIYTEQVVGGMGGGSECNTTREKEVLSLPDWQINDSGCFHAP